jgi:molybdopterin-guanine dinucleotide biosynthesis protein A
MKILGGIIAGGQSTRMGGLEKAFVDFGGRPLIAHIVDALRKQTDYVVINANGDPARFKGLGCDVIGDRPEFNATPLAGVAAVLKFAATHGFNGVVTTPSDTPFIPSDLVARLSGDHATIAHSRGQDHYLTGFWPVELTLLLTDATASNALRRMQDWVAQAGARKVEWSASPIDPFLNINTPEDLQLARNWLEKNA